MLILLLPGWVLWCYLMAGYTTIRVSLEDKERLRRLAKLMGCRSLSEALRRILDIAEAELEKHRGDLTAVLASLKHAKNIGETDATKVDEYLYGDA